MIQARWNKELAVERGNAKKESGMLQSEYNNLFHCLFCFARNFYFVFLGLLS